MPPTWSEDEILGAPYVRRDIELGADEEGELVATLIHRDGRPGRGSFGSHPAAHADVTSAGTVRPPAPAVLVLHGWSDYVFHRTVLDRLSAEGLDVWALDLRKYGRSIRPGQTPTSVSHLSDYDDEIGAALDAIGRERPPIVLAHSAGGLVAALWAMRHPGTLRAIAMNSPWLVSPLGTVGNGIVREATRAVAHAGVSRQVLPRGPHHYARSIHADYGGEFHFDLAWKPAGGHPVLAGTLHAILEGQRRCAAGRLDVPVLVLRSDATRYGWRFDDRMRRADTVLDVRAMDRAARALGPDVRVEVLPGARHDVFLSDPPVRERALHVLVRWLGSLRAVRA